MRLKYFFASNDAKPKLPVKDKHFFVFLQESCRNRPANGEIVHYKDYDGES